MIRHIAVLLIGCMLSATSHSRELVIFLDDQAFKYVDEEYNVVLTGPISSGRRGMETPTGQYEIQAKIKDKKSIKYKGIPMPYSLHLYEDLFVHQGKLPGYPASHGCVRLRREHAAFIFKNMRTGDTVTILD